MEGHALQQRTISGETGQTNMEKRNWANWAMLLAFVSIVAGAPAARAWGPDGHVVVARIAEAHLTPKARRALGPLLAGRDLADVASWADDWRDLHPETKPWHYVDIPLDAAAYDRARDCPQGACVVEALAAQVAVLRDERAPLLERQRALRFIVHFVGDLHQPLHAATDTHVPGPGGDHGGNAVKAQLTSSDPEFPYHSLPTGSLHGVWDVDLVAIEHREQEAFVAALAHPREGVARLQAGTFADWANESHALAREVAYAGLPAPDAGGVRQLGGDYAASCRPVVERQLQRAGLRLARVLNEAL
jgi:hypothetical protein